MAAVGTNSESKRYLPRKKKGNSPLTGERGERKVGENQTPTLDSRDSWAVSGRSSIRTFASHLLLEDEPRLRYRPSLPLNLAIALILAGPSIFHSIHDRSDQFHNIACPDRTFRVWSGRPNDRCSGTKQEDTGFRYCSSPKAVTSLFDPSLSQEYSDRRRSAASRITKAVLPEGACCKSVGEW